MSLSLWLLRVFIWIAGFAFACELVGTKSAAIVFVLIFILAVVTDVIKAFGNNARDTVTPSDLALLEQYEEWLSKTDRYAEIDVTHIRELIRIARIKQRWSKVQALKPNSPLTCTLKAENLRTHKFDDVWYSYDLK